MTSHINLYKDLFFNTYDEADDVRESIMEIAENLGRATMADLMRAVNQPIVFADTKFYWTIPMLSEVDISDCSYQKGYTLKFPEPIRELNAPKKVKVTKREYNDNEDDTDIKLEKPGPKPVYITINLDVHEDVGDVLGALFDYIHSEMDREFHITIE